MSLYITSNVVIYCTLYSVSHASLMQEEAICSAGETGTCRADWREGWRDWSDWSSGHPVFSPNWKMLLRTEWFPGYEVQGSGRSLLRERSSSVPACRKHVLPVFPWNYCKVPWVHFRQHRF